MIITLQPAPHTDHITEDGMELTKLPYPFHVDESGDIQRQDVWRGNPCRVIGFAADLNRQQVDLWWSQVVDDPQRAVGMYIITQDKNGGMATQIHAVQSVTVAE